MEWQFTTEAFRDPLPVREETVNGIEGRGLAEALRAGLRDRGLASGEVWPEDFGWAFTAQGRDASWLCVVSLDPLHEGEPRDVARQMYVVVQADRQRGLWARLTGRDQGRAEDDEPAALDLILRSLPDLRPSVS